MNTVVQLAVDRAPPRRGNSGLTSHNRVASKLGRSYFATECAGPYVGANKGAMACAKILGAIFPVLGTAEEVQQK